MVNTMQRFYLQMTTSANFGTNVVVNLQSDQFTELVISGGHHW